VRSIAGWSSAGPTQKTDEHSRSRSPDAGEEAVDAYVPYLVEVLNQTIYATLTGDEIETLVNLLARVTSSAHQLLEEQ
jgi:hypothetical protein